MRTSLRVFFKKGLSPFNTNSRESDWSHSIYHQQRCLALLRPSTWTNDIADHIKQDTEESRYRARSIMLIESATVTDGISN
ncbi:hypothetical protein J6590_077667 [Homalodisca vitripennis]|nr:hypothetical protein J6590_077667 [Homalodisca vitripennis]